MFRQHLFSCNCQLFTPQNKHHQQFRSPPAQFSRPVKQHKRSLKSQSSSRNRYLLDRQPLLAKTNKVSTKQLPTYQTSKQVPRTATSISPPAWHQQKRSTVITIKYKNHGKHVQMTKENQPVRFQLVEHPQRVNSPLHSQNYNIDKNVNTPVYHHHVSKEQRKIEVSPPTLEKTFKVSETSAGTTLAGSLAPSIEERWDRRSVVNPSSFKTFQTIRQQLQERSKLSSLIDENHLRQKAQSNYFGLSRLSQMINEKDETESIYEDSLTNNGDGIEFSRVLISCKKLMADEKGVLDHTKLFDFSQEQEVTRDDRSGLFEHVSLMKHEKH